MPLYPPYLGRVAGPMTRTVKDSALMMNVITGPDFRDHMSLPYQPMDYAKGLSKLKVKGLKIGLLTEMPSGLPADPAIVKAVKAAAKALEAEGAHVEVLKGFVTPSMLDGISCFFEQRSYNDISKLPAAQKKKLLPYIVDWATWRAKDFTGADVMRFYGEVVAMREAAVLATQPFDFVIQPCTCPVSYPAEHHSPTNDYKTALEHIPFTVAYNFSEQPAASLNWTYHSGRHADRRAGVGAALRRYRRDADEPSIGAVAAGAEGLAGGVKVDQVLRPARLPATCRVTCSRQRIIDGRLVLAALPPEPREHIGIDPKRDLLLDRSIKLAAHRAGPVKLLGDVGHIGVRAKARQLGVDLSHIPGRKLVARQASHDGPR